jgi:hypothetical protein
MLRIFTAVTCDVYDQPEPDPHALLVMHPTLESYWVL